MPSEAAAPEKTQQYVGHLRHHALIAQGPTAVQLSTAEDRAICKACRRPRGLHAHGKKAQHAWPRIRCDQKYYLEPAPVSAPNRKDR